MADEKKYDLLVEGRCKATPADSGMSKTRRGDDQYAVQFHIDEGPNAGRKVTWWGGFSGEGMKYTLKSLEVMGWDGVQDLAEFHPKSQVELVLAHDTLPAQGDKPARKVDRVKFINSLDGSGGAGLEKIKLSPAEAKAASQSLMVRIRAHKAGTSDGAPGGATVNEFAADPKENLPF
jgi:hypothetical protein